MLSDLSTEAQTILEAGIEAGLRGTALSESTTLCDRAIEDVIADISLKKAGTGKLMHALVEIVKCQAHELMEEKRGKASAGMSYAR